MRQVQKMAMPIDDLLVWAYRDQKAHRMAGGFSPRGPSASLAGPIGQMIELGCKVQGASFAAMALSDRTPDDAVIIHDAVLRLTDVWSEWRDGEVILWDHAGAAAVGCRIEPKGEVATIRCFDRDGVETGSAEAQSLGLRATIILAGENDLPPDWHPGWAPGRGSRAKDRAVVDARGRLRKGVGEISAQQVNVARAAYGAWHAALTVLAGDLAGLLAGFEPEPPRAPPAPWESADARGGEPRRGVSASGRAGASR